MNWAEKIVNAIYYASVGEQRRYHFAVPLFQRWLRHRRQQEDLLQLTLEQINLEMQHAGLVVPG